MIEPWFNFAVALGLGLLIGIERERNKGEGPDRQPAGIRTFALTTLLGATAIHVGGVTLLMIATAGVGLLAVLSSLRQPVGDPGLTTEVALISSPLIGALAMSDAALASEVGATVAVVLASKTTAHRFVKRVLTEAEVNDGLAFAIATLVVWPQLPDRYMGPYESLNPHNLWLVVILVLVIGACGHVATRLLGPRAGLPLSGLAAGFASSTAAIGSMAGRAAREPAAMISAVAGAALSTVATFVQMALLLFAVSRPTLAALAPALAAGGVVAAVYGSVFTLLAIRSKDAAEPEPGRVFSITTALTLVATMAVMLVMAAGLREWLGGTGIALGAAVAGIADTHSAAMSVASLVAAAKLAPRDAIVPILAAMSCNAGSKIVMAVGAGSSAFAFRIVPGLVLSMAAAWALAVPALLR